MIKKNAFFAKNVLQNWEYQEYQSSSVSLPNTIEKFMIFSEKPYFYLTLPNYKQNNRYWSDLTQEYGIEVPLNNIKLFGLVCDFSHSDFWTILFESTVYSAYYLKIIQTFLFPEWPRLAITEKLLFTFTILLTF